MRKLKLFKLDMSIFSKDIEPYIFTSLEQDELMSGINDYLSTNKTLQIKLLSEYLQKKYPNDITYFHRLFNVIELNIE